MSAHTEDTLLIRQAMAYAIEIYRELSEENGAPSLGTQNQVGRFYSGRPGIERAVARLGAAVEIDEATTAPPRRLPCDAPTGGFGPFSSRSWSHRSSPAPNQEPPTIGAVFRPPARYIGGNLP